MFVRRQRHNGTVMSVAAHLPLIHVATPEESDQHKAMKERIAGTTSRHGLKVQTEARSEDGRVITDVLVTGAVGRIGWEARYSPITASTVRGRSAKARDRNIAPLWVTTDAASAVVDRAP
jgi:competence CoiA-like predicted nuclease